MLFPRGCQGTWGLRGCGLRGGDVKSMPFHWSGCSRRTSTKCNVPLQGIPHCSPGIKPKSEDCQRGFWTCLLASLSSFIRVEMVRQFDWGSSGGHKCFLGLHFGWAGLVGGVESHKGHLSLTGMDYPESSGKGGVQEGGKTQGARTRPPVPSYQ